jgi:hypothetical protein
LHVRDDFALEPGEVGIYRQHDEKQQRDFNERDEDFGVLG